MEFASAGNGTRLTYTEQGAFLDGYDRPDAVSDLPGGSFVGPDGARENRGNPTLVGRSRRASDPELARRLWVLSEEMTGVTFEPAPASFG